MMVCEEDVLNIDPNRTRNAQTMDLAIFRNLAIDFVAWTRFFITVTEMSSSLQWSGLLKWKYTGLAAPIVDVHDIFTETVAKFSSSFTDIGFFASFIGKDFVICMWIIPQFWKPLWESNDTAC